MKEHLKQNWGDILFLLIIWIMLWGSATITGGWMGFIPFGVGFVFMCYLYWNIEIRK